MFELMDKKIMIILCSKIVLNCTYLFGLNSKIINVYLLSDHLMNSSSYILYVRRLFKVLAVQ